MTGQGTAGVQAQPRGAAGLLPVLAGGLFHCLPMPHLSSLLSLALTFCSRQRQHRARHCHGALGHTGRLPPSDEAAQPAEPTGELQ